ncbi:hypothetical protein GDO81_008110 [Engystomops pustulosus]|uniref:Uncharacterized protein n=1 Tax=Engystomops pustulosus TaxID=76066 RepID=A0AAV7CDS7_ENGPU|nr:hypothetical protein GDO81_008110 [Engystomops pustulosus]
MLPSVSNFCCAIAEIYCNHCLLHSRTMVLFIRCER